MALLECRVLPGLRAAEATAEIRDFQNQKHYLPVDREFIHTEGDKSYLPVSLLQTEPKSKAALVALPLEADSGAHRLWVKATELKDLTEVVI